MMQQLVDSVCSTMWEMFTSYVLNKVGSYFFFRGNFESLKENSRRLSNIASDVMTQIREGENLRKRKRKREVESWLEKVEEIKNVFLTLQTELQEEGFISRFARGDRVVKLNSRVEQLIQQSQDFGELLLDAYGTKGESLLTTSLVGDAFDKNLEKIWKFVVIDKIPIVGIYGMGGVGKTTLAKHIYNLLLEKTKCHVNWVTVSREFSISKLQNDIAKVIDLNISDENNEDKRAASLNRALSKMRDFVLVLDDVWDNLSLIRVGITHHLEGCRLIITTRSLEVCRQIGCRENVLVQTLCVNEAWSLFKETLGQETTLTQEVEEIAKSVAKECDGLPLGIVTLAGSMRGVTDIRVWKNTLTELKESLLGQDYDWEEDRVFGILKYSFDRLDPNYRRSRQEDRNRNGGYTKLQLCFLYCSLYPEDWIIGKNELISRFISEKFFEQRKRRDEEFDLGHVVLDKLVNVCLLESNQLFDGSDGVKMHDLVRDMSLKITRDNPKFKVLAGLSLKEFPCEEEHWTEDLEKMSLMENDICEIPQEMSPNCPKLSTLLLNDNSGLTFIPDSFFSLIRGLSVHDLSYTSINVLPNSVCDLESLNTLRVRCCSNLISMPNLGKLKALKELDLTDTRIAEVPQGMENLVNLKYLLLQYTRRLKMLPKGLLPRFKYLQYLSFPFVMEVDVEEIESLKHLEKLSCGIKDVYDLNRILQSGEVNITSFHIAIADQLCSIRSQERDIDGKYVTLYGYTLKKGEGNEETLVAQDIQHLELFKCVGLSNCVLDDLERLCCTPKSIKTLKVIDCEDIECIVRLTTTQTQLMIMSQEEELNSLEEIKLECLPNLMGVVDVAAKPPPIGLFSSLKQLSIYSCHKIKNLGLGLLLDLQNLEFIGIGSCDEIEEIIAVTNERRGGVVFLPKLKKWALLELPKLKSICDAKMCCSSIEVIWFSGCPKVTKLPLLFPHSSDGQSYSPPPNLKKIEIKEIEKEWWESLELDQPTHKDILRPFCKFY